MKKVAAVVVTYNRKKLLLECIESLLSQSAGRPGILVVDNASTDGTEEAVRHFAENGAVDYRNTGANLGGAGGFSFGVEAAVRAGYEYLWIMDDDSIPEKTALEELLRASDEIGKDAYGWLSSRVLWTDGSLCRMNVQRDRKLRPLKKLEGKKPAPAGAATFVSLFFPASVVKSEGLPIAEFFIWADDLEYTRRISRKYPCYVVPDSVVIHKCASNIGSNIALDDREKIGRYRYAYRNEVYLYRREGLRGFFHILLRTPLHIARVLRFSRDAKWKRIGVIIGSTLKGLRFHPEIREIT